MSYGFSGRLILLSILPALEMAKWKTHPGSFPFSPSISLLAPCSCCYGITLPNIILKYQSLPEAFLGETRVQWPMVGPCSAFMVRSKAGGYNPMSPAALWALMCFSVGRCWHGDVCHLSPTSACRFLE